MAQRKILYSPQFGAGWTSWESDPEIKTLMLTYAPIIDALERGERVTKDHPAIAQLQADVTALGKDMPYLGGLRDIAIATVNGPVRIQEYDGSESIETQNDAQEGWL